MSSMLARIERQWSSSSCFAPAPAVAPPEVLPAGLESLPHPTAASSSPTISHGVQRAALGVTADGGMEKTSSGRRTAGFDGPSPAISMFIAFSFRTESLLHP